MPHLLGLPPCNPAQPLPQFYSDGYFLAPFDEFLENRLVTNQKSADTYVYLFTHRGEISFPDLLPAFGFPVPQIEADLGEF